MIIFDFDGVLIDPIRELALTTYNLVTNSSLSSLEELPSGYLELFCFNRHHSVTPSSLISLSLLTLETLASGGSPTTFFSIEEFSTKSNIEDANLSPANFFAARQRLIDEHPLKWLDLNKPFPLIWAAIQRLDPSKYFILTNKNRNAVKKICSHYGLTVSEGNLFTGEKGRTKKENILDLDKIGNRDTNYILLDDAIENLESLSPVLPGRIHPIIATWGYGSSQDHLTAQKHGYELASEREFIEKYISE